MLPPAGLGALSSHRLADLLPARPARWAQLAASRSRGSRRYEGLCGGCSWAGSGTLTWGLPAHRWGGALREGRGRDRGCGGVGRARPPPARATCPGGTLVCAPTGRPGPPAAASTPAAPQVERGGWARSPARGGRAHSPREPSGQRRPGRGPAGARSPGPSAGSAGPRCVLGRVAPLCLGARNRPGGLTARCARPWPGRGRRWGEGWGAAGWRETAGDARRPPGPLGMLRLWTAGKGRGLSRWRDGLGRIREAAKVGPKRSLSRIRILRPLPLSGVLLSLPLLQMGNPESRRERRCAWERLWLGGAVAEATPLRARGVPWPQFPHLTPAGRSSLLLVRLS